MEKEITDEIKQTLLLKEQRVDYWERFHSIPTVHDLLNSDTGGII